MNELAVDAETLHQAANDVRNTKEDVEGDLNSLQSLIGELESGWTGKAGTSFQGLMNRWNDASGKLLGALGDIGDLLDKGGESHTQSDEDQDASMSKFDVI